jgi:NitT/TauT family transport system substrate-binding protein
MFFATSLFDWSENMQLSRLRAAQAIAGALVLPSFAQAGRAADLPTLKVAIQPIEPSCQPYYAQANGYLDKAGIGVDVSTVQTSPVILQALLSGTYDIGSATVTTLALAHLKELPIVIVGPQAVVERGVVQGGIVVSASSTIKGARDLEGKTFAVSGLGTIAEFVPRAWVDKNGGDSATMKFTEVPFPTIGDAIAAGRADAGWLNEPFFTIATRKGQVKLLTTTDDAMPPVYLATAWFATAAWAKAHADLVSRFVRSMNQAGVWANANPDKVVPILVDKLKADPAMLAIGHRTTFTDKLVNAQIQPLIDIVTRYQKVPTFSASELIFRG